MLRETQTPFYSIWNWSRIPFPTTITVRLHTHTHIYIGVYEKYFHFLKAFTLKLIIPLYYFTLCKFFFQTVLFDPYIGPYQVLPLRVRVDLGAVVMKKYTSIPKALGWEPHYQIISGHSLGKKSYTSAELRYVYFTAIAAWAENVSKRLWEKLLQGQYLFWNLRFESPKRNVSVRKMRQCVLVIIY